MGRGKRERRADQLRPRLEAASVDQSIRSIAREIGLSHATLSNFLHGQTPSERTLNKIERWLADGHTGDQQGRHLPGEPALAYTESPAGRLVQALTSSEEMRQLVAEIGPERVVKAAYAVALEEGWAEEELEKLDRWRKRVLGELS